MPPTPAPPQDSPHRTTTDRHPIVPSLLFLIGQLIVLGMGAARIELTARSGDLPQRLALPEMIAFQLAIASISFSTVITLPTVVGSAVFIYLAGLLTETPIAAEVWVILLMVVWMIALQQLAALVADKAGRAILSSIFSAFVIGVPIAGYLVTDFSDARVPRFDPISIAILQSVSAHPLLPTIMQLIATTAAAFFFALRIRRQQRA